MRVHELAKELGVTSKDVMAQIEKLGGAVKNHMSQVEGAILEKIKTARAPVKAASKPAKEKAQTAPSKKEAAVAVAPPPKKETSAPAPKPAPAKTESKPSPAPTAAVAEPPKAKGPIIRFPITVGNLSAQLSQRIPDVIKALMGMGIFANVNQLLNEEIGFRLAGSLGIAIQAEEDQAAEAGRLDSQQDEDPKKLKLRPPVVTMMGHVDHGKTSLLDAIRKTNVAAKEKGFITQHIGAYGVDIPGKGHVTFLDTPGHEAFTAMRARGANITDVVVLVVAADDGVMPQTVEAYNHAREAGCPIVVAVNKMDLPSANPQRVMTGLQKLGLMPEEWGGKTICIKVSAKTGKGIDELLEMLLLESEVLELKANPDRLAVGTVIEGHLSKGSGPVATVIVQKGTLKVGDMLVSGPHMGRVRSLRNDRGKPAQEAGPSYAVEVSGLSGIPEAGETFRVVEDEKTARRITEIRTLEIREREMSGAKKHLSLEGLYERISEGNIKELKIIIKADVQGSIEALAGSLEKLSNEKCRVRVIHGGVGGINDADVMLAVASDAIVIGFHVKAEIKAGEIAEKEGVDMRFYGIIYEAVEDVRKAMEGLLEPTYKEVLEGKAQIRKIFKSSKAGNIGGCMVVQGKIVRTGHVRLVRGQVIAYEGKLAALKRFKDDVREVAQGYECGISISGFDDLQEGDVIECYRTDKIATKL